MTTSVYLVHAVGAQAFKVGYSSNVPGRLRQLQLLTFHDLELVAEHPGGNGYEDAVLCEFTRRFTPVRAEWFTAPSLKGAVSAFHEACALYGSGDGAFRRRLYTFIEQRRALRSLKQAETTMRKAKARAKAAGVGEVRS